MAQFNPDERKPLLSGGVGDTSSPKPVALRREIVDDMEETGMKKKEKSSAFSGKTGLVVVCILMTELCERLTYYSVVANLVLFCTSKLDIPSSDAANISLVFSGTVYLIPVVGGYISDSYAGKYNTILGSGLIYLLGLFLLPASAIDYTGWFGKDDEGAEYDLSIETRKAYFFMGLVFVAIGTGGIKANVGPYGAQQVNDLGPEAVQSFFNWFYWFINAGSLVAYSGVAYIQQNISFTIGFIIPLASMIVALIIFVAARNMYINNAVGGSILSKAFGVCTATKCRGFKTARKDNGGPYSNEMVDGVIAVLRVLPVFLLIIMYWAVYSQMQSTFFLQSERMNVMVGDVKMPAAVLNIFNTVIILVLIPIIDRGIYPLLAKYGRSPSHLQRIGLGMILAALSVVVAGVLEIYRKQELSESGGIIQELADDKFNASTLSVFLQVPEFALVGASEVFASISGLEFAYSEAPEFMQGLVMGLFLMTSGIGNYVSTLILVIVKAASTGDPWFPDEINEGKAEYLFFLIGGLMVVNFLVFLIIAKLYKTRASIEQKPELLSDPIMDKKHIEYEPGYHDNPLATDTKM
ncbi:solute carrier family 15 member 4-like [Ylistrum balloti]|uniref:solute carrier family 15 member 4-like n=1 Tax=Ylistrum balloti TaxID=509963 RepID=UPI002905A7D6|nr:solute carrier family 15 member 4-like [Ylistrum balloti]